MSGASTWAGFVTRGDPKGIEACGQPYGVTA